MSENLRSKHAFGSEANVDAALANGLIDAYDILFLKEGKIGWIDKDGNKVILEDKKQIVVLETLPESGEEGILYVVNSIGYTWNGSEFKTIAETSSMDETVVDSKIEAAQSSTLEDAKAYTDQQIADAMSNEVVEF